MRRQPSIPKTLPNDLESQAMRWFNAGNALDQIPSSVFAADRAPNPGLVPFSSDRAGQRRPQKERGAPGNILIEHYVIPDRFRAGFDVNSRCNRFADRFAREQPAHKTVPSCCMLARVPCRPYRTCQLDFGVTSHLILSKLRLDPGRTC